MDFRKLAHVIGGHGPSAAPVHMTVTQSASLPVLTFDSRKFVTRKVHPAIGDADPASTAKLPGYTGHQHASQARSIFGFLSFRECGSNSSVVSLAAAPQVSLAAAPRARRRSSPRTPSPPAPASAPFHDLLPQSAPP